MPNKAKLWRSGLYFCDISIFFLSVTAVLSLTWPLNAYTHAHTHTLGRCGMGLAEATPCRIKNSPEDLVWLWFHWASVNHCTSIQRAKWSAAGRDNRNELPGASTYLKNRSRKPCSYIVRRMIMIFFVVVFLKNNGRTVEICIPVTFEVAEATQERVKGSRASRAFCTEVFYWAHVGSATHVSVGDLRIDAL